jgi:F0F1-type ATP synthase membrane subunit b/b'
MVGAISAILINLIVVFIVFLILNARIKKNSAPHLLDEYTREIEDLIVEMNRAVDEAVDVAEERTEELKGLLAAVERLMKRPTVRKALAAADAAVKAEKHPQTAAEEPVTEGTGKRNTAKLMESTRHLLSMGHSKDEVAKMLNIGRGEVDLLDSLTR